MNQNYPSLDSSGHKPQDAEYEYAFPPRSREPTPERNQPRRTSTPERNQPRRTRTPDLNQSDLKQPLIETTPTSNPTINALKIHALLLLIEIVVFYIVLDHSYLFEYCFWSFGLTKFTESEFYPSQFPDKGSTSRFLFELECDKSDFNRCPGICEVVQRYSDSAYYFIIAASIRFVLHCISAVWIASESKGQNYAKIKKIFAYTHIAAFVILIGGISYILLYPGFQNLGEPLDSNEDELNPESFEWKTSFYLIIFIAIWMPATSLVAYSRFK